MIRRSCAPLLVLALACGGSTDSEQRDPSTAGAATPVVPATVAPSDCWVRPPEVDEQATHQPSEERRRACAAEAEEGWRSAAFQLVTVDRSISDEARREARACLLDESRPVEGCIPESMLAAIRGLREQRRIDCEGWPEALAACVLELPGASDCDPDSYPMWRNQVVRAEALGPAVAWQATVTPSDDYDRPLRLRWSDDGVLLVDDGDGRRALCGGRELWRTAYPEVPDALVGDHLVRPGDEGVELVSVRDAAIVRTVPLDGRAFQVGRAMAPGAATVLLEPRDEPTLHLLALDECLRGDDDCLGDARRLSGDLPWRHQLFAWPDVALVAGRDTVLRFREANGEPSRISFGREGDLVPLARSRVGYVERSGAAILDADCEGFLSGAAHFDDSVRMDRELPDGSTPLAERCLLAQRTRLGMDPIGPAPVGDHGLVFNDHGIAPRTHLVSTQGNGWRLATEGVGPVTSDGDRVYVVTESETQGYGVLVLAATDGRPLWHRPLPVEETRLDPTAIDVAQHGAWLALRLGSRLLVLQLEG